MGSGDAHGVHAICPICHLPVLDQAATPLDFPSILRGCNAPSRLGGEHVRVTGLLSPLLHVCASPSPSSVPRPRSASSYPPLTFSTPLFTFRRPSAFSRRRWRPLSGAELRAALSCGEQILSGGPCAPPSPGLLTLHSLSLFSSSQVLIYNFNCKRLTILSEEHGDIRTITL